MDLPRANSVGLLAPKVDCLVTLVTLSGMGFQLAAFGLVLEIFDAFAFVASNSAYADRRVRDGYAIVKVVIGSD